jgi:hypothetical protein
LSSESERAEYYEEHKGDPEVWGEGIPAKPRRRLASMISVRLSPAEAEAVRAAADERGLSVSGFLRMAALKEANRDASPKANVRQVVLPVPPSISLCNVAVTILSVSGPQDISKVGGVGLATQSMVPNW